MIFNKQNVMFEQQGKVHAIGPKQSNDIFFRVIFRVTVKCKRNEANMTST